MVFERKKGQGAFEYILMLSGVLLIVILIILILRGTLTNTNTTMQGTENQYVNQVTIQLLDSTGIVNVYVAEVGNGVTGAPCCNKQSAAGVRCQGGRGFSTTNCTGVISCASKQFDNMTGLCIG